MTPDDLVVEPDPFGVLLRPGGETGQAVLHLPDRGDVGPDGALRTAREVAVGTGAAVLCLRRPPTLAAALAAARAAHRRCAELGEVSVLGERLGAWLAVALLIRLRDAGAPPPARAVLVSALLDLRMEARSISLNAGVSRSLDVATLRRRVADFVGNTGTTDARIDPLRANLHGLPPHHFLAAAADPLLDDSLAYAARAAHDRVPVDLRVWSDPDEFHSAARRAIVRALGAPGAGAPPSLRVG